MPLSDRKQTALCHKRNHNLMGESEMIKSFLKKTAAAVLCAAVAVGSGVTALAAGKTYTIPELDNMSVTLPEDMTAVTRQSGQDDTYFSLFGADYTNTMTYFQSRDIYLQGKNNTASLVLTITMTETEESKGISNFNLLPAERLADVARNFLTNPDYSACTVDEPGKAVTWLTFDVNSGGNNSFQANTISGGKSIIVTMTREGESVTEADYQNFIGIINSAKFGQFAFFEQYKLFIFIGAGVLIALILLIIIISIARSAGKRKKKSENERILEELAGEYSRSGRGRTEHEPVRGESAARYEETPEEEESDAEDGRYTDEQIDAMLSGEEPEDFTEALPEATEEERKTDDEQITVYSRIARQEPQPVPAEKAVETTPQYPDDTAEETTVHSEAEESVPAEEDTTDDDDFFAGVSFEEEPEEDPDEFPGDFPEDEEPESEMTEAVLAQPAAEEPLEEPEEGPIGSSAEEAPEETPEEIVEVPAEESIEKQTEEITEEPAEVPVEVPEENPEEAFAEEAPEETVEEPAEAPEEPAEEPADSAEETAEDEEDSESGEPDELEEYMNDEDLVREQARGTRFRNSNDFFDEAPRKIVGVISSRDIDEAEEYDVIGEVERRATEVERETPKPVKKNKGFGDTMKAIGAGIGSFFTHCGYFITNVKREIKRSRAKKKRKKAEEERRRRARERAAQQRAQQRQRDDNGLVQVRSRGGRPAQTGKRSSSQTTARRSSSQAPKRKSSSQTGKRSSSQTTTRRSSSQTPKRKSSSQTNKRRPQQSGARRPSNKR